MAMKEKLKKGDCFAYKIENDEEYKDRYLIFVVDDLNNIYESNDYTFIYSKITKDSKLPTSKNEIEELDYIISRVTSMEERFYPLDGNRSSKDLIKERSKVKVYPDELGYLYTYVTKIFCKKFLLANYIYIGNYDFQHPKKEFIPFSVSNIPLVITKNIEKLLLYYYKSYNLKESELWSINYRKKIKKYNDELLNIIIDLEKNNCDLENH